MKQATRRQVLTSIPVATTTAIAGCSSDTLDTYDDVTISNSTPGRKAGSVTVVDPTETVVLDQPFDHPGDNSLIGYKDVITQSGAYPITIELTDGNGIDSQIKTTQTVNVGEPQVGHINIAIKKPADSSLMIEIFLEEHTEVGEWG